MPPASVQQRDNANIRASRGRSNQSSDDRSSSSSGSSSGTSAQRMATSSTTSDRLAVEDTPLERKRAQHHPMVTPNRAPPKDDSANPQPSTDLSDTTPLASAAAMAARREFVGAPMRSSNAYEAYRGMKSHSFAGPDDMRLKQLERGVIASNETFQAKVESADIPNTQTYARAKGPFSTLSKIDAYDKTIGQMDDLSAARIDVDVTKPGMADVYDAQQKANVAVGDDLKLNKDFIKQPTSAGYAGRLHSNLVEKSGLTHELQVGTKDLSDFIDHRLTTKAGDGISVHDALYKSDVYGINVDKPLQTEYSGLMKEITRTNKAGQEVADVAVLEQRVSTFYSNVEGALPDKLDRPPGPTLSTRAKVGNSLGKGFGVLGIAGGGLQAYNGVSTLANDGDKVEGVADIGAGTGGIASGAALMTGRVALGAGTGGAVAVIDGAKDIYVGVRDGDVEKGVVGAVKAGAGTAMLAGVATANPVLIAGGAIAYGGAVVYESRDAIASGAKSAWNWATSWL